MNGLSTIGMDTSKSIFQLHGVDARGACLLVRRLKRREVLAFFAKLPPLTVAMEACGASHYWARELEALGHRVKLVPVAFAKRFCEGRRKTDARDARALALAGMSGELRAVPVKSAERQAELLQVQSRSRLVRDHTGIGNSLRGHLAEFGVTAKLGGKGLEEALETVESGEAGLPEAAIPGIAALVRVWRMLGEEISKLTARVHECAKKDETARRLMSVPGTGPIIAAVFKLKVGDPARFACGRNCAAWLGLTGTPHNTAKRTRNGSITKAGDEDLRSLLVLGAASILMRVRRNPKDADPWVARIAKQKKFKVAAVALAARMARTLWALLMHGGTYRPRGLKPAEA